MKILLIDKFGLEFNPNACTEQCPFWCKETKNCSVDPPEETKWLCAFLKPISEREKSQ